MKALTLILIALVLFVVEASTGVLIKQTESKIQLENTYACIWYTYCNDPESYSPILQPKSDKTETQDTKDEKLA